MQHVAIAHDHWPFCDQPDRRAAARERFDGLPGEPVLPLDGLIWIGRSAERHQLARPRRAIELTPQHLDQVAFHENHGREVIVRIHFELDVIAPGEAVVTPVRASAIRVEGPMEGHALHTIERRAA